MRNLQTICAIVFFFFVQLFSGASLAVSPGLRGDKISLSVYRFPILWRLELFQKQSAASLDERQTNNFRAAGKSWLVKSFKALNLKRSHVWIWGCATVLCPHLVSTHSGKDKDTWLLCHQNSQKSLIPTLSNIRGMFCKANSSLRVRCPRPSSFPSHVFFGIQGYFIP